MDDLLARLRAREIARHGLQVGAQASSSASSYSWRTSQNERAWSTWCASRRRSLYLRRGNTIARAFFNDDNILLFAVKLLACTTYNRPTKTQRTSYSYEYSQLIALKSEMNRVASRCPTTPLNEQACFGSGFDDDYCCTYSTSAYVRFANESLLRVIPGRKTRNTRCLK